MLFGRYYFEFWLQLYQKTMQNASYNCKLSIVYLCKLIVIIMEITSWYSSHFEKNLEGRYITLEHILPLLDVYRNVFNISTIGQSEMGRDIPMIQIGNGNKVVLAWSQMHGNESTTTKSIFDVLKFFSNENDWDLEKRQFLASHTLYLIPILNPDGATNYTRVNANNIDINRDAVTLSQKESRVLSDIFKTVNPTLCLNLHGQRTIYGLDNGHSATVSFLAPAADNERTLTLARKEAMLGINSMNNFLQRIIPGQVGRYDDSFNENCVGDTFQMAGVPTILFEAGHFEMDYNREKTREFIFYAFLSLFGVVDNVEKSEKYEEYFRIPENIVNFKDIIINNVHVAKHGLTSVSIQYEEVLQQGRIVFQPVIDSIGSLSEFFAHKTIDGGGAFLLLNLQENVSIGDNVSTIVDKNDHSNVIFSNT